MDIFSAIIVLGIVAVISLPFLLYSLYKKQKNKEFLKDFMRIAEKEKITLSHKEIWANCYIIGIDNNAKKILYTNKRKGNQESTVIDLLQVEKCRIANINRTVKNLNGNSSTSDRLELVFTFKHTAPEKVLEFYDSTEFMPAEKELTCIDNWSTIVNSNLR
jgi:hypothetical protein